MAGYRKRKTIKRVMLRDCKRLAGLLAGMFAMLCTEAQTPAIVSFSGGFSFTWLNQTGTQGDGCLGCGTVTYSQLDPKLACGGLFTIGVKYPLAPRWSIRTGYGMYLRRGMFDYARHYSGPATTYPDDIPHSAQSDQEGTNYFAQWLIGAALGMEYRLIPKTGLYGFTAMRPELVLADFSKRVYDETTYQVNFSDSLFGEVYDERYASGDAGIQTQNWNISGLLGFGWQVNEVFSVEAVYQYGFIPYQEYEISFKNSGIEISGCILLRGKKTG